MPPTVDYQPIANGGSANVETQAQYLIDLAGGGSLQNGYQAGLAKSVQVNKTLRQLSMVSAAVANFIANQLGINVLDDGNLANLITILTAAINSNGGGQSYYKFASTSATTFVPSGSGDVIKINGLVYPIPAGGLSIGNSGVEISGTPGGTLANSTTYDTYLKIVGATLTPSFWPDTGGGTHMTDTTAGNVGVEVRNNSGSPDSTRSLIGKVATNSLGQFQAQGTGVISWFGRKVIPLFSSASSVNFSNGTMAELSTALRIPFLRWAGDGISFDFSGVVSSGTASQNIALQAAIDGAAVGVFQQVFVNVASALYNFFTANSVDSYAEGSHTATLFGEAGATSTLNQTNGRVYTRG